MEQVTESQVAEVTNAPETENAVQDTGRVFTQEEVNKMMAKEKREGKLSVLKELGVEDVKNAKEGLKRYQDYLDSQKTEAEKAQAEVQRLAQEKAELEEKARMADIQVAALKNGIKADFLEDAIILAQNKKTDAMTYDDIFNELKQSYPSFAGTVQTSTPKGTGDLPKPTATQHQSMADDYGKRLAEARLAQRTANTGNYFKED